MSVELDQSSVIAAVREWHSQGEELRAKLVREREALMARVQEIDAALALIAPAPVLTVPTTKGEAIFVTPPAPNSNKTGSTFTIRALRNLSMPSAVRRIVEAHPAGISAKAITELVREIHPKVDPGLVHSALYRNVTGGTVRSEGSRGSRLYFPGAAPAPSAQSGEAHSDRLPEDSE